MRRDGDHDMDVIRRDMPLQDIDARLPTFFPYNRPHPLSDLTAQGLVAIFGDPHDMEVDRKRRMGAMAIVTHVPQSTQNLLKLPPKQSVRFYAAMLSGLRLISCPFCFCLEKRCSTSRLCPRTAYSTDVCHPVHGKV